MGREEFLGDSDILNKTLKHLEEPRLQRHQKPTIQGMVTEHAGAIQALSQQQHGYIRCPPYSVPTGGCQVLLKPHTEQGCNRERYLVNKLTASFNVILSICLLLVLGGWDFLVNVSKKAVEPPNWTTQWVVHLVINLSNPTTQGTESLGQWGKPCQF